MLKQLTEATKHVVGVKQTAKAVEKGTAKLVFIAADADIRISRPLLESCEAAGVKVITADSKSNNRGFDARTWQSMRHSRWGCCRRGA